MSLIKSKVKEQCDCLFQIKTLEKNGIAFQREFNLWERFEKRVFRTNPLSRTDTFGTHCMINGRSK
jgi:hypothetical protein